MKTTVLIRAEIPPTHRLVSGTVCVSNPGAMDRMAAVHAVSLPLFLNQAKGLALKLVRELEASIHDGGEAPRFPRGRPSRARRGSADTR